MSTPLAIENLGAAARKHFLRTPVRTAASHRTALIRIAAVGLLATAACHFLPGDADPTPPATAHASAPAKAAPNAAHHVGEFSGTYHDGLPVYVFPTITVIGRRTPE